MKKYSIVIFSLFCFILGACVNTKENDVDKNIKQESEIKEKQKEAVDYSQIAKKESNENKATFESRTEKEQVIDINEENLNEKETNQNEIDISDEIIEKKTNEQEEVSPKLENQSQDQKLQEQSDIRDVSGYAEELFSIINAYRVENGLNPLQYHSGAQAFANKRVDEIMNNFSHSTQFDVRNETGLEPASENIASGSSASGTFTMWKNSSGHNYGMLHPLATYGAIGVKKDHIGRVYWILVTLQNVVSEGGWE